jgi:arginine-tRNA-protein transferase
MPPPSKCQLLPDQKWQLEYDLVYSLGQDEYQRRINQGWRRFGNMLFRPHCPACTACQPIRILAQDFRPNRSQRRVRKANTETVLVISDPVIDQVRHDLYMRHHAHHAAQKGWPLPEAEGALGSILSIVESSLPVKEWDFYRDDKLVAVCYVDELGEGFSGIYFYHDPDYRNLSLGTWMCMTLIDEAVKCSLPYVFLGYYVKGCRSMEYKGRFVPNQVLVADGLWEDFLE